jgi:probable HAF family extracellular repeat protein
MFYLSLSRLRHLALPNRERFRPRVEPLEDRLVPSTITDLGILNGGTISYAYSVNSSGQAVGYGDNADGDYNAFLYSDGAMTNLGTIGGGKYSDAYGINDQGQVVGYATIAADGPQHGFFYDNGVMNDLGTLGGKTSDAWAINNAGQVVGYADTIPGFGIPHAFLWDATNGMQDLGTLGGPLSYGYGLNQAGDATGSAMTADGLVHAFLYTNGAMTDIGTLPGGNYSQGWGVNASDQVVGFATVNNDQSYHAFSSLNGVMTDLGTLGGENSIAYSVNSAGDVVGLAELVPGHPASHPFLYQNGVMTDVTTLLPNGSGWNLLLAECITDNGLIVGVGRHGGSQDYHAYLMDLNADAPGALAAGAALQIMRNRTPLPFSDGFTPGASPAKPVIATTTTEAAPITLPATGMDSYFVVHAQDGSAGTLLGGDWGLMGSLTI